MAKGNGAAGAARTSAGGNVEITFGIFEGRVQLSWQEPTNVIAFDPQNAYEFGELLAREAHKARFGDYPADDKYLATQVRARLTEDLRGRMTVRAANMLNSLLRQHRPVNTIATLIVDAIFKEVA